MPPGLLLLFLLLLFFLRLLLLFLLLFLLHLTPAAQQINICPKQFLQSGRGRGSQEDISGGH